MKGVTINFFAVITVLLLSNTSYAQTVPDSLLNKLKNADNDSVKAMTLLQIGGSIEATNPEESLPYYQQALSISTSIKNYDCIFKCNIDIANCYIELNKMDSSILTFENAVTVARKMKDSVKVGRAFANLGNVFVHKNDRVKAFNYYLYAARLWEAGNDQKYLPTLYSNINALLEEQKEHSKALEYANKSVAMARKLNDSIAIVDGLVNLSVSYNNLENFEKAIQLLNEALPMAKKNGDLYQLATIYNNMGDHYYGKKNYPIALENYIQLYSYAKQIGNKYYLSTASLVLARTYNKLNIADKALIYIIEAEKLSDEIGERGELNEIFKTRAELEQQRGNYKLSSEYFSNALELQDSLFKSETSQKVAEVEAQYQNEKKQKEIVQLEKDKEIQALSIKQKSTFNYFLIGSLAALIIVSFLVYRNSRNRQQLAKQKDELQQQYIRDLEKDRQFVAVESILKGQEEERSRLAKDLHDGLGGLLSGVKFSISNMKDNLVMTHENLAVFERSLDMIDTSIQELRRVAHNMMPEMLTKFGLDEALKEYCNMINATKLITVKYQSHGMEYRIEKSTEIIIYRIIQELLNNTMKHAGATEVFVQLVHEGNRLNVGVEDNGKGFDTVVEKNKGAGLANIKSRVDYLKGRLDINSEPGKGTLVNIEFNL